MGLKRNILSFIGKKYLELKNVKIGDHPVFYGFPVIKIADGGNIIIGNNVVLCSNSTGNPLNINHPVSLSVIYPDGKIIIGDNTGISGASICAAKLVKIGNDCLIGANVTISDYDFHSLIPNGRRYNTSKDNIGCKPVVIEDNVWLGLNAIVLKGVTIGKNSVIAAGSIVTKSIPDNCVAAGNPAKIIKHLD